MKTNPSNETDITTLFDWTKRKIDDLLLSIDKFIKFVLRNIFWLIGLVILGGILGYVVDKTAAKKYESSLIIHANQNSTEYVYNFVKAFNEKLRDTIFLKDNGFQKHEIDKAGIEPIVVFNDLLMKYKNNSNTTLLQTLLENASAKDILESEFFRSDYMFHKIKMDLGKNSDATSIPKFMSLIDKNPYFQEVNAIDKAHNTRILQEYNQILQQIDTTIARFNERATSTAQKQGITVSSDQRNLINDLLVNKKITLAEIRGIRIDSIGLQQPLLLINEPLLVKKTTILNKLTILFPIFLVFLFLIISYFKHSIRKIKNRTITSTS